MAPRTSGARRSSRTQAERSDATRSALADAAIHLLIQRGWAATTTVAVVERAGVTRGALLHHYAGRSELIAAALQHLYDGYDAERIAPTSLVETVDEMWAVIGEFSFKAVIEAWLAAGNDRELESTLGPVIAEFAKLVHPDQHLATIAAPARQEQFTTFALAARETMFGLALGRAATGGSPLPHESRVIEHLRSEAARLDADPDPDPTRSATTDT